MTTAQDDAPWELTEDWFLSPCWAMATDRVAPEFKRSMLGIRHWRGLLSTIPKKLPQPHMPFLEDCVRGLGWALHSVRLSKRANGWAEDESQAVARPQTYSRELNDIATMARGLEERLRRASPNVLEQFEALTEDSSVLGDWQSSLSPTTRLLVPGDTESKPLIDRVSDVLADLAELASVAADQVPSTREGVILAERVVAAHIEHFGSVPGKSHQSWLIPFAHNVGDCAGVVCGGPAVLKAIEVAQRPG